MRAAALIRPRGISIASAPPAGFTALLLLAGLLAWKLGLFCANALWAISYPYELDYGEGIVWQQMREIVAGRGYGPIDGLPDIVFHYPPVYHALTAAIAAAGHFDELATGRSISILATLVSAAFVGLIAAQVLPNNEGLRTRWWCGAIAGLISLAALPVFSWAPLMRVDMLASALTLAGLWVSILALKRPNLIHPAALLFVAAIYTKQTMIAAPAAVFLVLLIRHRRLGVAGLATAIGTGLIALGALAWATDGGFLRHIFLYNINRAAFDQLLGLAGVIARHAVLLGLGGIGAAVCARHLFGNVSTEGGAADRASPEHRIPMLFVLTYFAITSAMLITISKVGANINYMIEWIFALSVLAVVPLRNVVRSVRADGRDGISALPRAIFPLALAAQLMVLPAGSMSSRYEPVRAQFDQLATRIGQADRPVVSDDMVLLLRSGREVVWEPAIFAELASVGRWDERPFVASILQREFAFFVTMGGRGSSPFDERYTPAVADAIERAYPHKAFIADLVLHYPSEPEEQSSLASASPI